MTVTIPGVPAVCECALGGDSRRNRTRTKIAHRPVASYDLNVDHVPAGLPGADLIERGLEDLRAGRESEVALLVAIGAPRLVQLGVAVPTVPDRPEHRLYALLARDDADSAHSRYNALLRRLVSFERALACAS